jgi:hypothetical protein
MSGPRQATCVWTIRPEVILAIADRFGDPTDSYVNGSQVWLRDNGPNEITLEWRMHPVPNYLPPHEIETFDVFPLTALGLNDDEEVAELPAPLEKLWDGLEAFAAFGDDIEPQPLVEASTEALGIIPDAFGLVDHELIGDAWEKSDRTISITDALFEQLNH